MKFIGKCSIGKKKTKERFEYPIIRFPKEFQNLIGKEVRTYQLDEKNFLISLELDNKLYNSIEFIKVDKNLFKRIKALGLDIF